MHEQLARVLFFRRLILSTYEGTTPWLLKLLKLAWPIPTELFYPCSHSQLYFFLLTETRRLWFRIVFGISGFFFCKVIASDRKICKMFTYIIKYQCFISRKVEKERSDFLCFVTNKQQISQDKSQTLLGSLLSRCKDITKNWILQTFPL